MMLTVVIVAVVVAVAVGLSVIAQRRRPDAPTSPRLAVPQQLDRRDFADAATPWLLVVFASATCASCRDAWDVFGGLDLPGLAVQRIDFPEGRDLHERYRIDSVPVAVIADADGVVRWSHLGAPARTLVAEVLDDLGITPHDDGTAIAFG